ncbi:MAG TPA: TetR/AcrR family transcriptional regulator [Gemmatimonadaceae bacterium]
MDTRERILTAALDVYTSHGFRGTTTRRVAATAGVNEVTIFRIFGSKQALLSEALRSPAGADSIGPLPLDVRDPAAALSAWTIDCLRSLGERAPVLRACIGDSAERPEVGEAIAAIRRSLFSELAGYLARLRDAGLVRSSVDLGAVAGMLAATIITDATVRDQAPDILPGHDQAATLYVTVVLTALGVAPRRAAVTPPVRAPAPPSLPDATGA